MTDLLAPLSIAPRYTRSVHLARDAQDAPGALVGYQATPLVLQTLARVLAGVQPAATTRAFSLIGPYGSGKSAFALFLSHLLSLDVADRSAHLMQHTRTDPVLLPSLDAPRLLPILISGNNSALRPAILTAVQQAIVDRVPGLAVSRNLEPLLHEPDVSPAAIADLVQELARQLACHTPYQGLVLVIDELGQHLDYAARQHTEADLFVLQTLAEMATRSGDTPCLILTILHQAFDRYARTAGEGQRTEWAKVQGRFTDLPFQEPAHDILRMVGGAMSPDVDLAPPLARKRQDWATQHAPLTHRLELVPVGIDAKEWHTLLFQTYPLHPLVLLALPRVFRHLAQNERSLFAFLSSHEPWSLHDVLEQHAATDGDLPIYRLPQLYSYIEATLGAGLFTRARGRRWAELAEAQLRVMGYAPTVLDMLTTIGTLNALGQSHDLRASAAHLSYALFDTLESQTARDAIDTLVHRQHIIYRRYSDSYVLWEGSDIDIDGLVSSARQHLATRRSLLDLLHEHAPLEPLVARRHSYRTGSVRQFAVRFVEADRLPPDAELPPYSDGELLYVVPADDELSQRAMAWVADPARHAEHQRIVVLPTQMQRLHDLLLDVAALHTVLSEHRELDQDSVARREIGSQLVEAQQLLDEALTRAYHPEQSSWWWRGTRQPVRTIRQRDELLSSVADTVYAGSPHVWNELIMRHHLPSASAKARRSLMEAMLEQGHCEALGITGYPPERAIYASVLAQSGIHRQEPDGVWRFGAPAAGDPTNLHPTWQAIQVFFQQAAGTIRPLSELYDTLLRPPLGVKEGLIPILFLAAYLEQSGELALYERGNYVTVPDMAFFERLVRQPAHIGIRLSRVQGVRSAVYERLARVLAPAALSRPVQPALLDAVNPLLKLVHSLPEYTRTTGTLSDTALAVREALFTARAPDELLFETLPRACRIDDFHAGASDDGVVEAFFGKLKLSLMELQDAYPRLIKLFSERIQRAFGVGSSEHDAMREELLDRYYRLADTTSDGQVRAFGVRLEHAPGSPAWLESVAALIGRKPMSTWRDHEVQENLRVIADLGRRFRVIEQLAVVTGDTAPADVVRVGIFDDTGERSRVLRTTQQTPRMQQAKQELQAQIDQYADLTSEQQMIILTDILRSLLAQQRSDEDE